METSFMHKLRENSWIGIVVALYLGAGAITYYADQYYKNHPQVQKPQKPNQSNSLNLGDPNAPVCLEFFVDYGCPYSKKFWKETFPKLAEEYVAKGLVYFSFRDFPLDSHTNSANAALAVRAGAKQDNNSLIDFLFNNRNLWESSEDPQEVFANFLEDASHYAWSNFPRDFDAEKFAQDYKSQELRAALEDDKKYGQALGINAVPFFVVKNKDGMSVKMVGAQDYSEFSKTIEACLK